jgi:serine/threonine-protein kinase
VSPANAVVEVDGTATPVQDGAVEINGALGSVHRVRIRSGSKERSMQIIVAETGAVPPEISIGIPALPKGPTKEIAPAKPEPEVSTPAAAIVKPVTPQPQPAPAQPKPSKPASGLSLEKKFE